MIYVKNNIFKTTEEDKHNGIPFPIEKLQGYAVIPKERFLEILEQAGITLDEFMAE